MPNDIEETHGSLLCALRASAGETPAVQVTGETRSQQHVAKALNMICVSQRFLEAARAAHGAMVAGLAAGLHAADLLFLEIVYELGDHCLLHTKLFLTGMRNSSIDASQPG